MEIELSIVVPTCNERENVNKLAHRVEQVFYDMPYEMVFVDDSTDDTTVILEELTSKLASVRYHHRDQAKGLGTAVVEGFSLCRGNVIAVMDADLQHPPETLLTMLHRVHQGYNLVIASRFVPGGSDDGLCFHRKIISMAARYIGKIFLPSLRNINDMTSGFFMFQKSVINEVTLKPVGWKILMEILVKGQYNRIVEIPFCFHARSRGKSKMAFRESWDYLKHIWLLSRQQRQNRKKINESGKIYGSLFI